MTLPFFCVFLAFLMIYLSKAPLVIAMAKQPGGYDNRHPRAQQAQLTGWGARANAVHLNSIEAFPSFAASVLVCHIGGGDPKIAGILAVGFIVARIFYIPAYLYNQDKLRSSIWALGFLCASGLFALPFFS